MVAGFRIHSSAWKVGKTVLCVSIPIAQVSAFTPAAFPTALAPSTHQVASRPFAHDVSLRRKQASLCNEVSRQNWWLTSSTAARKRSTLRMSEPLAGTADAMVADPAVIPLEAVPAPIVETFETVIPSDPSSDESLVVSEPKRGIKKWFEDMSTSMTVPQATALLIVVVALTGVAFPLVKYVATGFDSTTILAGRFLVATLCLLPWLEVSKKLLLAGLETGAWLSAGLLAQALCLAGGTSAGVCSFFASMSCIVCPFLEAWAGVRLTARSWVAAALAVTGTAFLCLGNGALPTSGDVLGLLQPVLLGIYLFRTERSMQNNPGKAMELTAVQSAFVFVMAVVFGGASTVAAGGALPAVGELSTMAGAALVSMGSKLPQLGGLVFMGVFSSAFVIAAQTMVVTKLSSSKTSLMFATEPLFAAAVAFVLLGEGFGLNMVVGGALATVACVTASSDSFYSKLTSVGAGVKRLAGGRNRALPAAKQGVAKAQKAS